VDYNTIEHGEVPRRPSFQENTSQVSHNSDYDPFMDLRSRYKTTRKQRLKQSEENQGENLPQVNQAKPTENANISFPGESKVHEEQTREKRPEYLQNKFRRPNRNLNRSQNVLVNFGSHVHSNSTPNMRETNIKEALNDHTREE
jgi:hypothetical protein